MNDDPIIQALEDMFVETSYTPSNEYSHLTAREPYRLYDARVSALRAAHTSLSDMDCEKLILRAWLEISQEYDESPFSYEEYINRMDWWCEVLSEAPLPKLKDILSTVNESLILD